MFCIRCGIEIQSKTNFCQNCGLKLEKIVEFLEIEKTIAQNHSVKKKRVASIYYFNYTTDFGYYKSITGFDTNQLEYIELIAGTPPTRVNATPTQYLVDKECFPEIKESITKGAKNLISINENEATYGTEYIMIEYNDGTKKYYKNNKDIYEIFDIANKKRKEKGLAQK